MTIKEAKLLMIYRQPRELTWDEFDELDDVSIQTNFQKGYSNCYDLTSEQYYYREVKYFSELILNK